METIAYKLSCFCLSYDVWCDQINQCIDEIDPNNFKSHGAIFAIFLPPKTPYFLERTHKIITQRTSPAARCRPLYMCIWYETHLILIRRFIFHDDVMKWKHFPRNWPFVRGIHRSPVNSPHKGQWRGALMFSLICVWINNWVNNRETGDLRHYRAHYYVIAMWCGCVHHLAAIVMSVDDRFNFGAREAVLGWTNRFFYSSCFNIGLNGFPLLHFTRLRIFMTYTQLSLFRHMKYSKVIITIAILKQNIFIFTKLTFFQYCYDLHYSDVIMSAMVHQITGVLIVWPTVGQIKH